MNERERIMTISNCNIESALDMMIGDILSRQDLILKTISVEDKLVLLKAMNESIQLHHEALSKLIDNTESLINKLKEDKNATESNE